MQHVLPQLSFSFYRHQLIRADFSGDQITSDAGLLPLRAFDQRHPSDSRAGRRAQRSAARGSCAPRFTIIMLLRQRIYQIVAGYRIQRHYACHYWSVECNSNGEAGGIWQSGGAPADAAGNVQSVRGCLWDHSIGFLFTNDSETEIDMEQTGNKPDAVDCANWSGFANYQDKPCTRWEANEC